MISFLFDEHVPDALRTGLLQREPMLQIWRVGEPGAPQLSAPDPQLLTWCEQHDFALVTNNRKTMPAHLAKHLAAGRHIPGIVLVGPMMSLGEIIEDIVLIALATEPHEYFGRIIFLPLK